MDNTELLDRIAREHQRQVDLGWTAEHDKGHDSAAWVALIIKQVGDLAHGEAFTYVGPEPHIDRYDDQLVQLLTVTLKAAGWDGTTLVAGVSEAIEELHAVLLDENRGYDALIQAALAVTEANR